MKTSLAPKTFCNNPFGDVLPKEPYTLGEYWVPFRPDQKCPFLSIFGHFWTMTVLLLMHENLYKYLETSNISKYNLLNLQGQLNYLHQNVMIHIHNGHLDWQKFSQKAGLELA